MKTVFLPLYFLFFIITCGVSFSLDIQGPAPLVDNAPVDLTKHILLGEELTYVASWTGFPAGSVKTRVWSDYKELEGTKVFMFQATLETNDFVSMFYSIKNTLLSYTEANTGFSRVFSRKISEEDYQANDRVDYNYNHKNALGEPSPELLISLLRNNKVDKEETRSIPGKISDPLSFAWLVRGLEFDKIGSRKSLLIGDRFATGIVTLTLLAKERIILPDIGKFDCYVIKPEASTYDSNQNLLKVEGNARIWVEINTKIVIRAEADSPIGQASAVLTAYKNTNLDKYKITDDEQGD